jgi:hypothetical protein
MDPFFTWLGPDDLRMAPNHWGLATSSYASPRCLSHQVSCLCPTDAQSIVGEVIITGHRDGCPRAVATTYRYEVNGRQHRGTLADYARLWEYTRATGTHLSAHLQGPDGPCTVTVVSGGADDDSWWYYAISVGEETVLGAVDLTAPTFIRHHAQPDRTVPHVQLPGVEQSPLKYLVANVGRERRSTRRRASHKVLFNRWRSFI